MANDKLTRKLMKLEEGYSAPKITIKKGYLAPTRGKEQAGYQSPTSHQKPAVPFGGSGVQPPPEKSK
jgi:hypothetical protein